MTRRTFVIVAAVGLVLALASVALLPVAFATYGALLPTLAVPVFDAAASVLAAVVLLGRSATRVVFRALIPILSGIAALLSFAGIGSFWLNFDDTLVFDSNDEPFDWAPWVFLIAAFVAYLVAATLYGFAGQAQGVKVGARTGLLVLMLLSLVPVVDILGLIGFLITATRRKPA